MRNGGQGIVCLFPYQSRKIQGIIREFLIHLLGMKFDKADWSRIDSIDFIECELVPPKSPAEIILFNVQNDYRSSLQFKFRKLIFSIVLPYVLCLSAATKIGMDTG